MLSGIIISIIANALYAALALVVTRLRRRFKAQEDATKATLENYQLVAGFASAMQNSGLMVYLQTRLQVLTRLNHDLTVLLIVQILLILALATQWRPTSIIVLVSFAVGILSTAFTIWNVFSFNRGLDRLESAILAGFGAGAILDLKTKTTLAPNSKVP